MSLTFYWDDFQGTAYKIINSSLELITTTVHLDQPLFAITVAIMAPEPTRVINAISATCAAIFLLCLPIRLWELRKSSFKASPNWQGILKAASAPFPPHPLLGSIYMYEVLY